MIEVKKKILVIAFALVFMAFMVAPVMAEPATKIEGVTLTLATTLIPDPDSAIFADHNIVHYEGIAIGAATLDIPGQGSLSFTYDGVWSGSSKWTNPPNPDPDATNVIRSTVVLTCTDEGITGTFEGMLHGKTIGLPPPPLPGAVTSYIEYHMVFHGTGDFQGQTLKLSYAGAPPVEFEGTLIMPK